MKKCEFKKSKPEKVYHYDMCGLDYVYLTSGFKIENDPDFGECVSIHNAEALHIEIARNIVQYREKLFAQEIRFLRSVLDLTQTELAQKLGVDLRSVQRWESKKKPTEIDYAQESLIRIMFWESFVKPNKKFMEELEKIKKQREHYKFLHFKETKQEWRLDKKVA